MAASKNPKWKNPMIGFIPILLLDIWILTPGVTIRIAGKPSTPGEWGDLFGSANALFSAFALLGVVYAIIIQRQELSLQREELQASREELKASREQLRMSYEEQGKHTRLFLDQLETIRRSASFDQELESQKNEPLIRAHEIVDRGEKGSLILINEGSEIRHVTIDSPKFDPYVSVLEVWKTGKRHQFAFNIDTYKKKGLPFEITYRNLASGMWKERYEIPKGKPMLVKKSKVPYSAFSFLPWNSTPED